MQFAMKSTKAIMLCFPFLFFSFFHRYIEAHATLYFPAPLNTTENELHQYLIKQLIG